MKPVSRKRAKKLRDAKSYRDAFMASRPVCEIQLPGCYGRSSDCHEILSRARGGALDDDTNLMSLCRFCHDYVTTHPKEATERGWLRSAINGNQTSPIL